MVWIIGLPALIASLDSSHTMAVTGGAPCGCFLLWPPASDFTEPAHAKPNEGMDVISLREAALNPIPVR